MNCTCSTNTALHSIDCQQVAADQTNSMVNSEGEVFYPDNPDDAAWFAKEHGAWFIKD